MFKVSSLPATASGYKRHPRERLRTTTDLKSRRDQEEGGELDSYEEVSPEEIKRREVELGLRAGLLLLLLFPNGRCL